MAEGDTILATVVIAMPPECVFRTLTTDEVERWWGIRRHVPDDRVDCGPPRRWPMECARTRWGRADLPCHGEFLEIDAPCKIVQRRKYEWNHPLLGRRETMVTYRLESIAAGTRVTVRHESVAGLSEAADEHAVGWGRRIQPLTFDGVIVGRDVSHNGSLQGAIPASRG